MHTALRTTVQTTMPTARPGTTPMADGNPATSIPVWRQIAQTLTDGVADGTWPPGTAIPSETELSRQYGVARGTARKAMKHLVDQGLVIAVQGKGSYVTHNLPAAGS